MSNLDQFSCEICAIISLLFFQLFIDDDNWIRIINFGDLKCNKYNCITNVSFRFRLKNIRLKKHIMNYFPVFNIKVLFWLH